MRRTNALLMALLVAFAPPAYAQMDSADGSIQDQSLDRNADDEGNPRLGLLGLWGLAGLLGLIRRERNIHVDARRESRD